jgi:hypothetical protein
MKYLALTIAGLFATMAIANAAPNKDAIITKEKAAWQAFKDKKADAFKKLISADLVAVYPDGVNDFQKEMDSMTKTDMKSFDLTDFNVTFPAPDTAMITYKATVEATQEGKAMGGTFYCGSVWHMKNGKWMGVFHSEAKTEAAAKPAG